MPVTLQSDQTPLGKSPPSSKALEWAVIAAGGAIGACLRAGIAFAFATTPLHAAGATLTTNLIGSFLLGVLIGVHEVRHAPPLLGRFLAVGLLGSFTTFSALALDQRTMAAHSGEALAAVMIVGSIALGLIAFALGQRMVTTVAGTSAAAIAKNPGAGRDL